MLQVQPAPLLCMSLLLVKLMESTKHFHLRTFTPVPPPLCPEWTQSLASELAPEYACWQAFLLVTPRIPEQREDAEAEEELCR